MIGAPDLIDNRVDLDGVDLLGPGQGRLDIIARSRSDDQNVIEGGAAGISIKQIGKYIGWRRLRDLSHALVADVVRHNLLCLRKIVNLVIR